MKKMMKIRLGSTSSHKINAVREACKILGLEASVFGVQTKSGQNEQPVGFDEIFAGALTRAVSVHEPDGLTVGIENGIIHIGPNSSISTRITLDVAAIVILTADGRQIFTTSTGIEFPQRYVMMAEKKGLETTTVGSVIAEHMGGDPSDPHSILTSNRVDRAQTIINALVVGLKQL